MPRERLLRHGAGILTDAELLAIFLRTGRVGADVMTVAKSLIAEWGTLVGSLDARRRNSLVSLGSAKPRRQS